MIQEVVSVGGTASFVVTATGIPEPAYQWQKNGTNVPGATSATLTINNAARSDAGTYTVIVTNSAGVVTGSNALLAYNNSAPVANLDSYSRQLAWSIASHHLGHPARVGQRAIPAPAWRYLVDPTHPYHPTRNQYVPELCRAAYHRRLITR